MKNSAFFLYLPHMVTIMTRKKVELTYITNDSKRKTTLRKRKTGLIKKIGEISVLCGVEACAIIYTPNNPQPEVWPSNSGLQSVLSRFRGVSELEQSKKMLSQESFMRKTVIKAQEQLKKLKYDNRKKEMTIHMFHHFNGGNIFDNANMIDLNDIAYLTYQKLEEIKMNMNMIQAQEVTPVVENGGEIMTQGEQAVVNPVQGPETNVDIMETLNWCMDIINGGGEDDMFTFEDVDVQSGLIKKIGEISVLCGIEACAIIYTPNNPQPEVWPSDTGVQTVLSKFKKVTELEQSKKMLIQEGILRKTVIKAQDQLKKLKYENRKKEMTIHMFQHFNAGNNFGNADIIDLNDISYMTDQNLEEIHMKINMSQAQEVTPLVQNGGGGD
ncbi:Agamous-like MADS-box protein AGL80, partial [Mucuna pruriens]